MNIIRYQYDIDLNLDQVIELYNASTLGERRPVDDRQIMADHAQARQSRRHRLGRRLVGRNSAYAHGLQLRGLPSDLAVRVSHQRKGIGIQLVQRTREKMGPRSMLVLLAAPKAVDYYPKIGFAKHNSAWTIKAQDPFPIRDT